MNPPVSPPHPGRPHRPPVRWRKVAALCIGAIFVLALAAIVALWWWAGSEGSLATALQWIQKSQPLQAESVRGSLRNGGRIGHLSWQREGLTVEANDITLAWWPLALLYGRLQIDQISIGKLSVDDRSPPTPTSPPQGPPDGLGLPLRITVDEFSLAQFHLSGPADFAASAIAARYQFDGAKHRLRLDGAHIASGNYRGRGELTARHPTLDATLVGDVLPSLPGNEKAKTAAQTETQPNAQTKALPLGLHAHLRGPLTDLSLDAALDIAPIAADMPTDVPTDVPASVPPATAPPQAAQTSATATARLTPWAAQPLASAAVRFQNLDIAALWPEGPQTLLDGNIDVRADANVTPGHKAWSLQTRIANRLPGPWDKQHLPLQSLEATGEWRDGSALVRQLAAKLGNGELQGKGEWAASTSSTPSAWKLHITARNIDPAQMHSRMAALPLDGRADVQGDDSGISFDASAQAKNKIAGNTQDAHDNPHDPLHLRAAAVTGRWQSAGENRNGKLTLSALRVSSDEAQLQGELEAEPSTKGGKGNLQLTAPGLQARLQGTLRESSGKGTANLDIRSAAQALRWIQKLTAVLPAVPTALLTATANGSATFSADWQGGWRDPLLQAHLQSDTLQWRADANAQPLDFNAVEATLSGRLRQMQISMRAHLDDGLRRYAIQMAANGGRSHQGDWHGRVTRMSTNIEDPALGTWQIDTRGEVPLDWMPAQAGGTFSVGAGEAVLSTSRPSSASGEATRTATREANSGAARAEPQAEPQAETATLAWQSIRWHSRELSSGELSTRGKFTSLPLAWIERWTGAQKAAQAGGTAFAGNLLLDGDWDLSVGDTLKVDAHIARRSGDIMLQPERGATSRTGAGVKQASLSLHGDGDNMTLGWHWDSDHAGKVDGELKTRLNRTVARAASHPAGRAANHLAQADSDGPALFGWRWPGTAPVSGHLQARLPRIGIWSLMAPPAWRLRGSLQADIALGGTRAAPQLSGKLNADDLALRSVVDGIELGNGRLRATLNGTRMHIDEFSLQGAGAGGSGGKITAQGDAGWIDDRPQVQLDATLDRLRASVRSDRQLTVSGILQARLDGLNDNPAGGQATLSGKLVVDHARIVLPDEGTPQLGSDVVVRSAVGAATKEKNGGGNADSKAPRPVKLDVQLDLGRDFRIIGKGIDTRMRGTLAVGGDRLGNPQLNGTVTAVGGEYKAYGQWLKVEQGVLRFTGPVDNPALDILAIRPNLTQRVGVQITGTALLPRVRLYSEPDLPEAEKLSWLVVGHASASGGTESALLQQAALSLLGGKGGGMTGGLAASLGLDELSYSGPSTNADGTTSGNAVTLGKRFSRNFYVAYERSISSTLGTLYIFYDLSKRFTLRTQTGQQSAVDLIFTIPYD